MPLICKDCPNKEDFQKQLSGTCSYDITIYYDSDGTEVDRDGANYDNFEDDDFTNTEFLCNICSGSNIEDVEDDVWENWKGPLTENTAKNWKELIKKVK